MIGGYHGDAAAEAAVARWDREIGGGGLPADIPDRPLHGPRGRA